MEKDREARAERLAENFKATSDDGKKKILVILDDVWEEIDLKDIGLSLLANQGVDFKLLLTSRDERVCTSMGVEHDSIFRVGLLSEPESKLLFRKVVNISNDVHPELLEIGDFIAGRCGGLPIAIKTIASSLKNASKDVWDDMCSRLEEHNRDENLVKIFDMSYELLKDEAKAIFLLCGLFPDDFDIPIEDLKRYAWGLNLFRQVSTVRNARKRTKTCVEELRNANLEGFFLGNETFTWPSLDTFSIHRCPKITTFTNGESITPKLRVIDTDFGPCYVADKHPTSVIHAKLQEGFGFF